MEKKHVVPKELVAEGEVVLQLLKEEAEAQGKEAELYLLKPQTTKGFEPVTMTAAVLLMSGTSLTWLTSKWVDAYLWPIVQKRVDKPSREFIDWLDSKLPGGTPVAEAPGHEPR